MLGEPQFSAKAGNGYETMRAQELIFVKMESRTPDADGNPALLGGDRMASTASEGPAFGLGLVRGRAIWGPTFRPGVPALAGGCLIV